MFTLCWIAFPACRREKLPVTAIQQEGILRAHACIRWTIIAWAHQIWRREIENSRKVTVLLKAISLVLWIPYFPLKNALHDKKWKFSTRVFSCRFFSSRFSWPFKKTLKTQRQQSLFLYKTDFHWQNNAFLWVICKLMVFLIKEEMHRRMFSSLRKAKKKYFARFLY